MVNKIYFRVECTPKLGIGHFMRCISLANELIKNNKIYFLHSNNFIKNYKKFGDKRIKYLKIKTNINVDKFRVNSKKNQILDAEEIIKLLDYNKKNNIMIVDCYSIDHIWEEKVKKKLNKLIVIDDLANRIHNCDYLIDQTINRKKLSYIRITNSKCKLLLGSKYSIIRRQYNKLIANKKFFMNIFDRLNISFGNFDDKNLVLRALKEVNKSNFKFKRIDVFLSKYSKYYKNVKQFRDQSKINFNLYSDTKKFPEMLSNSTLCIGAGGTTSWERCIMQVPSIVINAANNQNTIIKELKKEKLIFYAGSSKVKKLKIINGIKYYNNINNLKFFISKAKQKFDIYGIKRIISEANI